MHFVFPIAATDKVKADDVISARFYDVWRSFLLDHPYANYYDWSVFFGGENKQMQIPRRESREIIKNLSLKAFEGKYKIMLIWLPETMHSSAANAILKILEEPPAKTVFLLVTEDLEQIISTILSRTQIVKVPVFQDEELRQLLQGKFGLESEKVDRLLPLAEGNARLALKLSSEVADDAQQLFIEWLRTCFRRDAPGLIQWAERFQKLSKAEQKGMLSFGISLLRESLLIGAEASSLVKAQGEGESFAGKFYQAIGMDKIAFVVDQLNTCIYHLERNANPKIMFLDLSFQVASTLNKK